jgi:hypothetical protein
LEKKNEKTLWETRRMSNQYNDARLDQITDDVLSMSYGEVCQYLGQYRSLSQDDAYDRLIVLRYEDDQYWANE